MYQLQEMSGDRALKILDDLLNSLSGINPEDMTTFELGVLHRCAKNPPEQRAGCENQINNASPPPMPWRGGEPAQEEKPSGWMRKPNK